ncbi:hypothetical protein Dvina_38135 [Dactylosporangium vinaceum]|uniref:Uncharacterized protein n=1 Tax=Dactylosporangium vinaceum TaxID=53362 RepID=A0ABV5MKW7_9ACTN|nr:hypothetical protein [Dactylosporangium vinaceum]UAB93973.1 hypothetical protein Dvina_38135 [Dactylosporangium vinaceum]
MKDWKGELDEVVRLNRWAGPEHAASRFQQVVEHCPPNELYALEPLVAAALKSFPLGHRQRMNAFLAIRRMARPTPRPAPAPGPALAAHEPVDEVRAAGGGVGEEDFIGRVDEISALLDNVHPGEAEKAFRLLIADLSDDQLLDRQDALFDVVELFLPKRRRALVTLLDDLLDAVDVPAPAVEPVTPPVPEPEPEPVTIPAPAAIRPAPPIPRRPPKKPVPRLDPTTRDYNFRQFNGALDELGRSHIFQWATFYRDVISEYFEAFLEAGDQTRVLATAKSALLSHSSQIFTKGYKHITTNQSAPAADPVHKSLAGLQRFLDLPLEFYSTRLADAHRAGSTKSLRRLASAFMSGILMGFGEAEFDQTGEKVLPRFPRSWAHVLPFLTVPDLRELITELQPGMFRELVRDTVMPLADTLDKLVDEDPENAPLPVLSQCMARPYRLEVSLQLPPNVSDSRSIDVQCYLSPDVTRSLIEDASARAVSVVITRLRSDLRGVIEPVDRLADIVVAAESAKAEDQVKSTLERIMYSRTADSKQDRPITWNSAQSFPLESPFLATTYNHVYRGSVRALMQSFERRNGVRLWCSVRRSGKTTACASDLGSTTGQTVVITQTCDDTGQLAGGGVVYARVLEALGRSRQLPDDFVMQAVIACQSGEPGNVARYVLVLDEYETLFGTLSNYLEERPALRYLVVQPLLNQLVRFTRDNLLVFMGQQPNAHYILLDQNQLSPVVEQDSFPLFTHDVARPRAGEFFELIRKVMRDAEFEPEFVTMVYGETGGHPFLTVKLLVAFMDWLIQGRYKVSDLNPVRADLFATFAKENLTRGQILRSKHYDFFQGAAEDHLSTVGRRKNRWLHDVYTVLRRIGLDSSTTMSCSETDYEVLAERSGIHSPLRLLANACDANFLAFDGGTVRPRIPLLARIAAAVTPEMEG